MESHILPRLQISISAQIIHPIHTCSWYKNKSNSEKSAAYKATPITNQKKMSFGGQTPTIIVLKEGELVDPERWISGGV